MSFEKFKVIDEPNRIIKLGSKYFQGCVGKTCDGFSGCGECVFNSLYRNPQNEKACDVVPEFYQYCHAIIHKNGDDDRVQFQEVENPAKAGRIVKMMARKKRHLQTELELEIISQIL